MCDWFDVGCNTGAAISKAAQNATQQWGQDIVASVGKVAGSLGTFWVNTPSATFVNPDGTLDPTVSFLLAHMGWVTGICAFVGFCIGGAKLMLLGRAQAGADLGRMLLVLGIMTGFSLTLMQLATEATDKFSAWFIDQALNGGEFGAKLVALLTFDHDLIALLILCGLIALLVSIVQIAVMVGRYAVMVIMGGVLPTSASFTNTASGQKWFNRMVSFAIAVWLYKPAASIVYGAAFMLAGSTGTDPVVKTAAGIMLMILALVAGPALFRFVSPGVAAAVGGSGGAAVGGAIGSLAAGAISNGSSGGKGFSSQSSSQGGMVSKSESTSRTETKAPSGSKEAAPSPQGSQTAPTGRAGLQAGGPGTGSAGAATAGGASGAAAGAGPAGTALAAAGMATKTAKAAGESIAAGSTGPSGAQEVNR